MGLNAILWYLHQIIVKMSLQSYHNISIDVEIIWNSARQVSHNLHLQLPVIRWYLVKGEAEVREWFMLSITGGILEKPSCDLFIQHLSSLLSRIYNFGIFSYILVAVTLKYSGLCKNWRWQWKLLAAQQKPSHHGRTSHNTGIRRKPLSSAVRETGGLWPANPSRC